MVNHSHRLTHNLKVAEPNPTPATIKIKGFVENHSLASDFVKALGKQMNKQVSKPSIRSYGYALLS